MKENEKEKERDIRLESCGVVQTSMRSTPPPLSRLSRSRPVRSGSLLVPPSIPVLDLRPAFEACFVADLSPSSFKALLLELSDFERPGLLARRLSLSCSTKSASERNTTGKSNKSNPRNYDKLMNYKTHK